MVHNSQCPNNVHYYFIHNTEVVEKDAFNQTTFFYFKNKINNENIHDVKELNFKFIKNRKKIKVDYSRLEEIEKKYTQFKGLNSQLLSAQATSTPYHDRFYYPLSTHEENLYWLILNYEKTESLLDSIKPDYIFDLNMAEIQRTVINEVSHKMGIPYITYEDARYETFILPTFNQGLKLEKHLIDTYKINKGSSNLEEYILELEDYRSQLNIMPKRYKGTTDFSFKFSMRDAIAHILGKTYKQARSQFYSIKNNKNRIKFNTPLIANPINRLLWNYIFAIRKFYLYSRLSIFQHQVMKNIYI